MEYLDVSLKTLEYCSIIIILSGLFLFKNKIGKVYFLCLFCIQVYSFYSAHNLLLIPILYTANLLFTSYLYLYQERIANPNSSKLIGFIVLCLINIILAVSYGGTDAYYWFARTLVNLIITAFSIIYFIKLYLEDMPHRHFFFINVSIFLFFGIDLFLSLTFDFLFIESLYLVSAFWLFRAILMQFYYLSLIYFNSNFYRTKHTTQVTA